MQSMQDPAEVEGWKLIGQMVDTLWEDGTVIYFHSPGGGGTYPKAKVLEWRGEVQSKQHIKEMARCDFWRGVAADDYSNTAWLRVASFMRARNCIDATDHNKAQYMEALTGAVYALATHNQFMINCFIEIQPSSKAALATEIWFELEKLGMKASNTTRERARQAIRAARRQKFLDEWPALAPRLTSPDMPHQSTSPTETERAEDIDQVDSHSLPNVRREVDDLLNMSKNSCNDAVAIQAVDSSVAQVKRAGYSSERAFSTIAARRHIYTGHTLPFAEWPEEEKQSFHSPDFLECHLWVNKLEPDTAYLDAKEIDSVVASVNAATSWTTQTEWRCNGCNTPDKKMRECWECGAWECKACSFWCTTCRKGYHQYTICGQCHAQGIYLKRAGKIWRCSWCEQRTR